MRRFKKVESGHYYFENKNNTYINGRTDWACCFIYRTYDNINKWGACLDGGMTFKTFKNLKEAREYFS